MLKWGVRAALSALIVATLVIVMNMNLTSSQVNMYVAIPCAVIGLAWSIAELIFRRQRMDAVRARLRKLGFHESSHAGLHYQPERWHRRFRIRYAMSADWKGMRVRVAEYAYTTGTGKFYEVHEFLEARMSVDRDMPPFRLEAPTGFMDRPVTQLFSAPPLAAEFGAFGRTTNVVADAPEAVARLLGPDLRQWLAERGVDETWCLRDGELSCTRSGALEEHEVESVLGRLATFVAKLPS